MGAGGSGGAEIPPWAQAVPLNPILLAIAAGGYRSVVLLCVCGFLQLPDSTGQPGARVRGACRGGVPVPTDRPKRPSGRLPPRPHTKRTTTQP